MTIEAYLTAPGLAATAAAVLGGTILWTIISNIFTSPIPSSVPGPFLARLTSKWILFVDLSGHRARVVHALHKKYGPVVRLGPNELSFACQEAIQTIYGPKSTCIKGPAYDYFGRRGMFHMKDPAEHRERQRRISHIFSASSLQQMEPLVQGVIDHTVSAVEKRSGEACDALHWYFVAGGVGITAFLALVEHYKSIHYGVTLHYAVRSAEEVPFRERLAKLGSEVVVVYDKAAGQRLDIRRIIEGMPWNSQLYFCGPKRLMDEAARETKAHGIAEKEVHFEAFEADVSGDPFEAVVANKGGKTVKVGEEETLLEVLQKEFGDVDSSCSVGNCGTCRISLKDGRVDHRGTALTEEDKATSMLACVSRGIGRITIEI